MNIEQLKFFVEVFQAKSFAKVAKLHDIAPSIISRSIANLEEEIGVALFYRTTRRVTPTEAGILFYSKVERISSEVTEAVERAQNLRSTPSGTLRVTAPVSFGVMYLPKIVREFKKLYPDLEIDLVITDSIVDIVEQRIDLAFRFGHLPDSSFVAKKLIKLDYVVCASPAFIKNNESLKKPEDISSMSCVQFLINGFNDGWKFRNNREKIKLIIPGKGVKVSNALVLRELVLYGVGIGLLPYVLIANDLKLKNLVNLFPTYDVTATEFDANIWMLYSSRDFLPEKVRLFMDFSVKYFAQNFR